MRADDPAQWRNGASVVIMYRRLPTIMVITVCVALIIGIIMPIVQRRRVKRELNSLSHDMMILGASILLYSEDHARRYPNCLDDLVKSGNLSADRAENISRHAAYFGAGLTRDTDDNKQIVAMQRLDANYPMPAVLLADGSVVGISFHNLREMTPTLESPVFVTFNGGELQLSREPTGVK